MRIRLTIAAVVAALAVAPPVARADHMDAHLPWPALLPPQEVSSAVQPKPVTSCRRPTLRCVDTVVRRMTARWRTLDRTCDHRAVFALTYLRTTEAFRTTLRRNPRYFSDLRWILLEDVIFADYYFRAYDAYSARRPPPRAWQIAFDAATGSRSQEGETNAGHDVFLGMNAHIQRDLPFVLARVGLRKRNGVSRKLDHDRVNEILTRVLDPIEDEVARRYDPLFSWADMKPSPLEELGALEVLKSWREGAWRNAERLLNAKTSADRRQVIQSIETWSTIWATAIAAGQVPGYRPIRDGHCLARFG
jgi:hypothetical protein